MHVRGRTFPCGRFAMFIYELFPFSFPQMGEAHEKTKESSDYLKYLTQQAVALQRTMNEIYKNGSNASIMPLKVTAQTHSVFSIKIARRNPLPLLCFSVHCPQHGQRPGAAQHHQRHHLYTTEVESGAVALFVHFDFHFFKFTVHSDHPHFFKH